MTTRRAVLSVAAGLTAALAGCEQPDETGGGDEFGLTTTGVEGAPGQAVGVDVTARGVGVVTYRVNALPPTWKVTQGDFGSQPTSIREKYPPELVWKPAVESATGTFIVAIPDGAGPGEYSLPIDARAGGSDDTAVSTAVITVEGQTTGRPTGEQTTSRPALREPGR